MDRRSFLIGAASAIITPSFYRDALRYAERKAAPLIVPPDDYSEIVYELPDGTGKYDLYLGTHPLEDNPPDYSWREFNREAWNWSEHYLVRYLQDCNGLETEEEAEELLDTPADINEVLEWYGRHDSANARAFNELQDLDLGPVVGTYRSRGELRFIDGPCPGNDSLIVTANDMTSLSLLQARLIEINAGILVKPSSWNIKELAA